MVCLAQASQARTFPTSNPGMPLDTSMTCLDKDGPMRRPDCNCALSIPISSHCPGQQQPVEAVELPIQTRRPPPVDAVERERWSQVLQLCSQHARLVLNPVPHVKQQYSWDCGLACSLMVVRAVGFSCDYSLLRQLCPTTSIWTIDLAHLLKRFGLDVTFTTITLGPNPAFYNESFYLAHMQDDERRVSQLFHDAPCAGIRVAQRSLCWQQLAVQLLQGDTVILVLVDRRKLDPWLISVDLCLPYAFCGMDLGYAGHYILLVGWDAVTSQFLVQDPSSSPEGPVAEPARVSPFALDSARRAFGTDEDILMVRHAAFAKNLLVIPAAQQPLQARAQLSLARHSAPLISSSQQHHTALLQQPASQPASTLQPHTVGIDTEMSGNSASISQASNEQHGMTNEQHDLRDKQDVQPQVSSEQSAAIVQLMQQAGTCNDGSIQEQRQAGWAVLGPAVQAALVSQIKAHHISHLPVLTQPGTSCEAQQSQPAPSTAKQKKQLHNTTDLIALSQSCRDMSWVIDMPRQQPQQKQPQTNITDTTMQDAAGASDEVNQEQSNQKPLKPSTTGAWGLLGLISHASVATASPNNPTSKQTTQPVKAKVDDKPSSNEVEEAKPTGTTAELDVEKGESTQMDCQQPNADMQVNGTANAAATNSTAVSYSSWANLWAWAPCWSYTPLSSSPSSKAATTGQSSSKSSSVASSCQENDTSMLDDDETTSCLGRQGSLSVHAVQHAQVAVQ